MKRVLVGILVVMGLMGCLAQPVMATSDLNDNICDDFDGELGQVAGCGEDGRADQVANRVIEIVSGVLGVVAVGVMIYGGFVFLTSNGDASKVTKGKNVILYGLIGLIVALLAYAIVRFVGGVIGR